MPQRATKLPNATEMYSTQKWGDAGKSGLIHLALSGTVEVMIRTIGRK